MIVRLLWIACAALFTCLWLSKGSALSESDKKETIESTTKEANPKEANPKEANPKEANPKETTPSLAEAASMASRRTSTRPPPPVDEVRAAQDKRAREIARLRGEITFDDLKLDIEKDGLFESSMLTDEIKALDGKKNVRIRGFMLPASVFQTKGIKQFVLVRDNQECCFGPGAAIYDCIMIEMAEGRTTDFQLNKVITVAGSFSIDTESYQYPDGGHYAIFKMIATEAK